MLPFYSVNFVLLIVFAVFFYRAAEFEDGPGVFWATLLVAVSLLVWQWLRWGLFAMILGQAGLFAGISVFRATRKS